MPPKTRASKKRAHSPEPKTKKASKRSKHASPAAAAVDEGTAQKPDDATDASSSKPADADADAPSPPSFHGNFDLYAMSLRFLNSVFTPERDYAELLKVIRTYQAKPDNSGQIYIPKDLARGRLRTPAFEEPLEEAPFDLALEDLTLKDALTFTPREAAGAFFSEPADGTATATPGVTGSIDLEDGHCGVSSTSGTFKMRRAWVSADGKDEVFECFLSGKIVFSGLYRRRGSGNSVNESYPFWAIRARVGADGKEIGLGRGE